MPHAFILGGTGQIGWATTDYLLDGGWSVTIAHRGTRALPHGLVERGAKLVLMDRERPGELRRALSSGADALIDAIAYGPGHARQLLEVQSSVGSIVVISSSSVYRDSVGRTLDEAAETGFPILPVPITESQSTVDPGPETYSTRKVALERVLLDEAVVPLMILRPAAISGPGSSHAREWWFVKRILDRRSFIPLAYGGRSRFHTTSASNIAGLIALVAGVGGQRILNIADTDPLSVSEIANHIAHCLAFSGRFVELPDVGVYPPPLGRTPWSVQSSFVLDTAAATKLGYRARAAYPETASKVCDWLLRATAKIDWRSLLPVLASYPYDLFDYESEDVFLAPIG